MELNTVRVFVRDLVEARRFYGHKLGLPLKADGSAYGYCVFRSGGMDLVVESVADDAPDEDQALVGRFTGLSFAVPDAAAKHRELASLGIVFTGLPEKQRWGGTIATLQDPSGNAIQILPAPHTA